MRYFKFWSLCTLLAVASFLWPAQAQVQTPQADALPTAVALQEVFAQQQTLSDNQGKIEEKLAAIGEKIRLARLYSARAK